MTTLNTQFFFRDRPERNLHSGIEMFETRMDAPFVIPSGSTKTSYTRTSIITGVIAILSREVDQ